MLTVPSCTIPHTTKLFEFSGQCSSWKHAVDEPSREPKRQLYLRTCIFFRYLRLIFIYMCIYIFTYIYICVCVYVYQKVHPLCVYQYVYSCTVYVWFFVFWHINRMHMHIKSCKHTLLSRMFFLRCQSKTKGYFWHHEMGQKSHVHHLGLVVHPNYLQAMFLYIPGGCDGFLNHQPYVFKKMRYFWFTWGMTYYPDIWGWFS